MSYSIKDLKTLVNSVEFHDFQDIHQKLINLGEKIYTRRKDLGLTQTDLGVRAEVPQNKISQMESGTYGEAGTEILERLSKALDIQTEYLEDDSITRKTVEVYNYVLSKLDNVPDIMQFMKLPYFIDLAFVKNNLKQPTNFEYIRWRYGPFDKKVYDYQKLFSFDNEKGIKNLSFIYLSEEERKLIDATLASIPRNNGEELKKLSYETTPMKKLGVCLGDSKCMGEVLILA